MREVQSKARRSLVVAGTAGMATLAAPQILKTRLAQSIVAPASAQAVPGPTGEIKVQYAHRKGQWGIGARGYNAIPMEIYNQFGHGTKPVVHEVQIHLRLDHPRATALRVELISPDGHTETIMARPGYRSNSGVHHCSKKGIDITIVDTEQPNCCASLRSDAYKYCPEYTTKGADKWFGTWASRVLKGIFHTSNLPEYRTLPKFNGRPSRGTWLVKVYNDYDKNVNKVIRQIDLTVYSKW